MLITENQLDNWVRGNAEVAQGVVVELVDRLIAASVPRPDERRFPLGDSMGQPGEDGFLVTQQGFPPYVPKGISYWEIGTGGKPGTKATADYRELTKATEPNDRTQATFVFVTPLSGTRGWNGPAQKRWLRKKHRDADWLDVRVLDGTALVAWMREFPAAGSWLAARMGFSSHQIQTPEQRWVELRRFGEPPPLPAPLLLANREAACQKVGELFEQGSVRLKVDTRFPRQVADFVSAYVSTLAEPLRSEVTGRCLIACDTRAWSELVTLRDRHVLIADFDLDDADSSGMRLLENAKGAGHSVIYSGSPGGVPNLGRVTLGAPRSHEVERALQEGGYREERARSLAQRAGGDLNSVLRLIRDLSLSPEWSQASDASDLAIAVLLGEWRDDSGADRLVAEGLSGKAYGEWIGRMREVALRPAAPLIQREKRWKFVVRFEGWFGLGPRVFDEHLDRLRQVATAVLGEADPRFELAPSDRFAAAIHGKVHAHSRGLRRGLAESLALLGSHPRALTSCTREKPETIAVLVVRSLLSDADWLRWASLNDVLPYLAEAAPSEFLSCVESALSRVTCPFEQVIAQEESGVMGTTYMSGLLWSLETLAWDERHLARVAICLGGLSERDPGGAFANRPGNTLATILLPWYPQTCASVERRIAVVTSVLGEYPAAGWKLLLKLLPDAQTTSMATRRPAWRDTIPDDWSTTVTNREYWNLTNVYAEMALGAAKGSKKRLQELIGRIESLPRTASDQLLEHLQSDEVIAMPEVDRLGIWEGLVQLVGKHRKFSDTHWAMKPEEVAQIFEVSEKVAPRDPRLRERRLFSERSLDLLEERGDFEAQEAELDRRRKVAIKEIAARGGEQEVLSFATEVESPWRVGMAFGSVAAEHIDSRILPSALRSAGKPISQFASGYVWSRYVCRGLEWVDGVDTSGWTAEEIGQFFSFLPFISEIWERAGRVLGDHESAYWVMASANPYGPGAGLEPAIELLLKYGRPNAALRCLARMVYSNLRVDGELAARALLDAEESPEGAEALDRHRTLEVIKMLQSAQDLDPSRLFQVEWAYLPLLDRFSGVPPKHLWKELATKPSFYCELIRLVFRPEASEVSSTEPTEPAKRIAANAYRLLSEWRSPPGLKPDGPFDGQALLDWIEAVRKDSADTGHLSMATMMMGHALVYVPADPDGLWIHSAAAAALNAKDAEDMRDGFRTELFNSRGVHGDSAGTEERALAKLFGDRADAAESAGFSRLAATLRDLASSYERDAERETERSMSGD